MTTLIYLAVPCGAADPQVDNQQPIDRAPSLDNSTGVSGGLEQQWSSGKWGQTIHTES